MQLKVPYVVLEKVGLTDYLIRIGNNTDLPSEHVKGICFQVDRGSSVYCESILDPPGDCSLEIEPLLGKPEETIQQVSISPELDASQT